MITHEDTVPVLILGGVGLFLFLGGIMARLGLYKSLYAMKGNTAFAPPALTYTVIPASIIFLMYTISFFLPTVNSRSNFAIFVIFPYQLIVILLTIWRPWWLKPKWLRWLEEEHGNIINLLWEDVRKDRWEWERTVRTQEDLEEWVSTVRRKHGLA